MQRQKGAMRCLDDAVPGHSACLEAGGTLVLQCLQEHSLTCRSRCRV